MNALDLSTINIQIVLPVALIAWLAFAPVGSRIGFSIQAIATGLVLLALLLIAVWMIPPWWAPYLYLAIWLGVLIWQAPARLRRQPWLPGNTLNWMGATAFTALGVICVSLVIQGVQGRSPPPEAKPIDIVFPMGPGTYLVANGGAHQIINGHLKTLHPKTERQSAYRGQSYAIDFIKIDNFGLRAPGWRPSDPAAYAIFGEPVYAPCSGTVIEVSDGQADMPVPKMDQSKLEGNHVLIQCGEAAVLLAHFRNGSVRVAPGDRVKVGQPVGEAGNSGQTSEPHLHIHMQRLPSPGPLLSGEPLFLAFDGQFPIRNDRIVIKAERSTNTVPSR